MESPNAASAWMLVSVRRVVQTLIALLLFQAYVTGEVSIFGPCHLWINAILVGRYLFHTRELPETIPDRGQQFNIASSDSSDQRFSTLWISLDSLCFECIAWHITYSDGNDLLLIPSCIGKFAPHTLSAFHNRNYFPLLTTMKFL